MFERDSLKYLAEALTVLEQDLSVMFELKPAPFLVGSGCSEELQGE